jgi:transmembrane sensor
VQEASEASLLGDQASAHTVRFVDGSSARLFGDQSELELVRNERARVGLRLHAGRAHFEVVPNQARTFEIDVAPYRVVVLGTVFDIDRAREHVEVSVSRGRVRVYGPHGAEDLKPGQSKRFMIEQPASSTASEPEAATALEEAAPEPPARAPRPARASHEAPNWRSLTQSGDYDAAFASLRRERAVDNDPSVLMDAADAARLSGHPSVAVGYLERVVRGHASSPVAPLAAFTLGRVYLDRLGRPHEAARSFARVRQLSPSGSLAEDALAREVESLSKAGDAKKAYLRAQEYLRRYPAGPRLRAVRLYGGLD